MDIENEYQARLAALNHASNICYNRPELSVIETAKTFLDFLQGKSPWKTKLVDSASKGVIGVLTDKNHIYSKVKMNFFNIYEELGFISEHDLPEKSVRDTIHSSESPITNWKDPSIKEDLRIYYKGNDWRICKELMWEPEIEKKIKIEYMKSQGKIQNIGYIDGRHSHLGSFSSQGMSSANMFPGYVIWIESGLITKTISK